MSALHFVSPTEEPLPGLVSVEDDISSLPVDIQISVREARQLGETQRGIDYVFFRRFTDGRSAQAAAYIIDNRADRLNEKAIAEIHRRAWLQGHAPLLYVAWESRIDILSCAGGPTFWKNDTSEYTPAVKALSLAAEISESLQRFSAHRLLNGTFWEDPENQELADAEKNAQALLFKSLVETDVEIDGTNNPGRRRLLLIVILIKYLEDRGVFPYPGWFGHYQPGARSFFDVLENADPVPVYRLLRALEVRFNGDVFRLPELDALQLTPEDLRHFATFARSDTSRRQQSFWKLFDFKYIPVEVISHIYQYFARREHGAIFTPPFVVNLMLDFAMPYSSLDADMRILDPTCGSGAFLVSAFRRIINSIRSRSQWRHLSVQELKTTLRRTVFGIELQEDALHLTSFNLALAICDSLHPEIIWRDLRFEALASPTGNLRPGDFFALKESFLDCKFDLILGNPPFKAKLTTPAAEAAYRASAPQEPVTPDKQLAY